LKKALKKMTNQKTKYKNFKDKNETLHFHGTNDILNLSNGMPGGGFVFVFVGHRRSNNGSQLAHELTVGQFCSIKHYKTMLMNSGLN
jgi:hypothetical protein